MEVPPAACRTGGPRRNVTRKRGAVGRTLADLTLALRGPTLATLVRPRSEDLFVDRRPFLWIEDLFVTLKYDSNKVPRNQSFYGITCYILSTIQKGYY